MVSLLLSLVRHGDERGYTRMLEAFWDEARDFGLELPQERPVTAQAFSQARGKLPSAVVRGLLHRAADEFDARHGDELRWHGRRLLDVDGARRFVQCSDELRHAYGRPDGAHYPMVHVTTLFDVTSQLPLDAVVGRYGADERAQLLLVLDRAREGDVLVLDRGYPSFDVLSVLALRGLDFVVRVPASSTFKAVEEFLATGRREGEIALVPPPGSPMTDMEPLRVRIVVVSRRGDEPWVLLTSLATAEFTAADVADAYTRRWRIEEYYKLLVGAYFGQGFFHARTVRGVEQEILAQMLFVAIARLLAAAAARLADVPYERVSQKAIILATADHLTRLVLHRSTDRAHDHLTRLFERLARAVEKPRRSRSYPRRSLLPARKWGPAGRHSGA